MCDIAPQPPRPEPHSALDAAGPDGVEPIRVTAVVPCCDEVDGIDLAYQRIATELGRYDDVELLFVDDGSTDGTLDRIKAFAGADPRVFYLSFTRNFGLEAAFAAGFKYASQDWVVQLDADLQSPPAEVHKLMAKALEGWDVVFGIRTDRHDPLPRRLGSRMQHWFARRVLGIELPHGSSSFRVVRASVARKIAAAELPMPYFLATVPRVGARWTVVPTEHRPRARGRSKFSPGRLLAHTIELFLGFSVRPLAALPVLAGVLAAATALGAVAVATGRLGAAGAADAALAVGTLNLVTLAVTAATCSASSAVSPGWPATTCARPTCRWRPRTTSTSMSAVAPSPPGASRQRGPSPWSSWAAAPIRCPPTRRPGGSAAGSSAWTGAPTRQLRSWPTASSA
jgi:polyisoprenyl-phosphate glycosyltransferase